MGKKERARHLRNARTRAQDASLEAPNENSADDSIHAEIEQPAESSAMAELGDATNAFYMPKEIELIKDLEKDLDVSLFHPWPSSLFQDRQPSVPPLPTLSELTAGGEHDITDDDATELDEQEFSDLPVAPPSSPGSTDQRAASASPPVDLLMDKFPKIGVQRLPPRTRTVMPGQDDLSILFPDQRPGIDVRDTQSTMTAMPAQDDLNIIFPEEGPEIDVQVIDRILYAMGVWPKSSSDEKDPSEF